MAAHMGRKRTSEKLFRRYWWPGLRQDVKRFIQEKTKKWFDGNTRERRFEVGESVLVLIPEMKSKLEALYSAPYTVMEQVSPVTYKLDLRGQHGLGRVVHIN